MGLLRCYCNTRELRERGGNAWLGVLSVWVLVSGVLILSVEGSLPLIKKCGEITCTAHEYCNQIYHTCDPCKDICENESNNFQEDRCVSECQDYIHDERYLKLQNSTLLELQRTELEEKYKGLEKDVLILKIAICVCVAVIAIVVACLLAFLVYFYKLMHPSQVDGSGEKKKPVSNKSSSVELPTVYNNRYGVTTPTPETSPTSASVISSSPADTNVSAVTGSTTIPPYNPTPPHNIVGIASRSSPTKSETSIATPGTMTTTLMSGSGSSTLVNGTCHAAGTRSGSLTGNGVPKSNRFRREPSESTLPDHCAYDNLSMSPQHTHYSHHV